MLHMLFCGVKAMSLHSSGKWQTAVRWILQIIVIHATYIAIDIYDVYINIMYS